MLYFPIEHYGSIKTCYEAKRIQMLFKKKRSNNGHYIDSTTAAFEGDITARLRRSGYSSYYHKYFEGYVEKQVTDSKGKKHIVRTYVGDYHIHSMTDKQWVGLKLLYAVLYLLACVSLIYGASRNNLANVTWFVRAGTGIAVVVMFIFLYTLVNYEIAQRKLTIWGYHETSETMKTKCLVALGAIGLSAFSQIVFIVMFFKVINLSSEAVTLVFTIISALFMLAIYFIEAKAVKYDVVPSGNEGDSDAINV